MAAPKTAVGVASGRLDMAGGVADYSGSLVLQVQTEVATTIKAELLAEGGGEAGAVALSSEAFEPVTLTLAPLRAAGGSVELPAVAAWLKEQGAPGWTRYVYGCIAAFLKETGWLPPAGSLLKLAVSSTVPASAGVSSSASVEVATLRALVAISGVDVSQLRIAHLGQAAENYVVGAACGLMDQLASALGSPGRVLPILCRPDATEAPVPLPAGVVLVGWPSGIKHSVGASPYLTARTATFMGKRIVEGLLGRKTSFITELSPSTLATVLERVPETMTGAAFLKAHGGVDDKLSVIREEETYHLRAAVAFPVHENFRCALSLSLLKAAAAIGAPAARPRDAATARLLSQVGELMAQTHAGYNTIGLGCHETDAIVAALMKLGPDAGVYGARVSGGGSGGTVAVLCESWALPAVEALAKSMPFGEEPFGGLIN